MYLNAFSQGHVPLDLTTTPEFQSLLDSASDLGISGDPSIRYQSRNTIANGLRFHFLEWGDPDKQDIVLLHGGNQTSHSWDLVSWHLAQNYHVIAIDQRGHGDSEWPRDCNSGPTAMASDAAEIITQLGLEKPIVVGHSMGGIVTMTLIRDNPGLASRAVLVDVGPELSQEGTQTIGAFIRSIGEYDSVDEFVDRVSSYDPFRSREHIMRTVRYNLLLRSDGKYVSKHDGRRHALTISTEQALRARPTMDDMSKVEMPILIIRGEQSNVLPIDAAERFRSVLRDAECVTVANCGHNVHSQNTEGFLEVLLPFIAAA